VGTPTEQWDAWGRWTFRLMLPIGLLVTLWAWIGRLFLGSGGWFMLIFVFTVLPVMLAALVVAWTSRSR
jgi:hypothetical protein